MYPPPQDPNNPSNKFDFSEPSSSGYPSQPNIAPIYNEPYVSPYPMVQSRTRRRGCGLGVILLLAVGLPLCTLILILGIGFGLFGFVFDILGSFGGIGGTLATAAATVNNVTGQTQPIVGDPANFDPFAEFAQAQTFAGSDTQISAISAYYVRNDGTMDLTADYTPSPRATYEFLRLIPRPADAPPIGVSGGGTQWYEPVQIEAYRPGQTSRITQTGGAVNVSTTFVNQGLRRTVSDATNNPFNLPVEPPRCTTAELWRIAMQNDAPRDAVAIIEYGEDGYTFNIPSVVYLTFDEDCKLE